MRTPWVLPLVVVVAGCGGARGGDEKPQGRLTLREAKVQAKEAAAALCPDNPEPSVTRCTPLPKGWRCQFDQFEADGSGSSGAIDVPLPELEPGQETATLC